MNIEHVSRLIEKGTQVGFREIILHHQEEVFVSLALQKYRQRYVTYAYAIKVCDYAQDVPLLEAITAFNSGTQAIEYLEQQAKAWGFALTLAPFKGKKVFNPAIIEQIAS